MRKARIMSGAVVGVVVVAWWSTHRRSGTKWVNRAIDPWLVDHGIVDRSRGEIGLIEHVGRRSGIVRASPVRPVPTETGFRIVVPLGLESQWARNVLAAGHCRLQVGDTVFQLDEPSLVSPLAVPGLSPLIAHATDLLGFRYLLLHRFDQAVESVANEAGPAVEVEVDQEPVPA